MKLWRCGLEGGSLASLGGGYLMRGDRGGTTIGGSYQGEEERERDRERERGWLGGERVDSVG